jgi:ribonuclease G
LVQITRQRVRPELVIKTQEPNPSGLGEVEAPIVLIDKIGVELDKLIASKKHKKIFLNAHPFIAAYLKKGLPSIQQRWFTKYKKWIKILPRDAYQYLRFDFSDSNGDIIK